MILSHKIRIYPNKEQEIFLKKSCGVARFTYNWALEEWEKEYKAGNKPSAFKLSKIFNSIKKQDFPFVCEVSKCCSQISFFNLNAAFRNFFNKNAKYPTFKKKGVHNSFGLDNLNFSLNEKSCKLAKMSSMRMAEKLRFNGKIMSGTVSNVADKWFLSVAVELEDNFKLPKTDKYVGVDLGVKEIAITSDGHKFANPQWIKESEKKLKRLQRELARRQRASKRRERTKLRLARQYYKITNQRKDYLNKLTTFLVRNYDVIALEDLNVRGMVKNHNLAKAIMNVSFGEFNRQIEYKSQLYDRRIYRVDRFFPSSKMCSACGCVQEKMPLYVREWTCPECGTHHDRDINASINLVRQAVPEFTHGESQALTMVDSIVKLDSMNRESFNFIK